MSSRKRRQRERREARQQATESSLLQKLKGIYTPRRLIVATGIAAVLAAGAFGVYRALPSYEPDITPIEQTGEAPADSIDVVAGPRYEDVLEGNVTPEEYVNHLSETLPELVEAKEKGWLQGVYYNPNDADLDAIIHEYLTNQGLEKGREAYSINYSHIIDKLKDSDRDPISTISHTIGGSGNFSPIIVWSEVFSPDRNLERDEEFRNIIGRHEPRHVKDGYLGISYDRELIDEDKLSEDSEKFMDMLHELRGTTDEISHVLTHPGESFSDDYKRQMIALFINYRDNLCPSNKYEQEIKDKQLEEIPFSVSLTENTMGATHKYLPNKIVLPYDIFKADLACPQ